MRNKLQRNSLHTGKQILAFAIRPLTIIYVMAMDLLFNVFALHEYQRKTESFHNNSRLLFVCAIWGYLFLLIIRFCIFLFGILRTKRHKNLLGWVMYHVLLIVFIVSTSVYLAYGTHLKLLWKWLPAYDAFVSLLLDAIILQEAGHSIFKMVDLRENRKENGYVYAGIMLAVGCFCFFRIFINVRQLAIWMH